ncbi:hypothetical protein MJA45_24640 [Paenibacillus aurantius]|uniref:Uncharacterized protein n=1 Tax=Paenibacillus aurantius TaxID=2918900 RepID=A0AA96LES9_9BACL|nr:hypothetical protein [Paenibacillus aurantius]WNQ10771.1 hypothetical protein MJA45_24640 [Paenibacillus aurantius]
MTKPTASLRGIRRKLTLSLAAIALGLTTLIGWAPQASAAYNTGAVCGSGYTYLYSHALRNWSSSEYANATLRIYINRSTKKVCNYVTSTGSWYGVKKYMTSDIGRSGGITVDKSAGYYYYYAGPNYMSYTDDNTFVVNNGRVTINGKTYTWNAQAPIWQLAEWGS